MKAGDLRHRVIVEKVAYSEETDANGNVQELRQTASVEAAHYRTLRGGETVQQARLEGRQVLVITVRANKVTRTIRPDWRLIDARDGRLFEITAPIVETEDRRWVEITCTDTGEGVELSTFDPETLVVT